VLLGELEANKHLKQSKTLLRPSDRLPSWFEKVLCALRSPRLVGYTRGARLYPKTIEELSLTLEGVDDVHGSNCLAISVLGI
jgi:hypothetical protein